MRWLLNVMAEKRNSSTGDGQRRSIHWPGPGVGTWSPSGTGTGGPGVRYTSVWRSTSGSAPPWR